MDRIFPALLALLLLAAPAWAQPEDGSFLRPIGSRTRTVAEEARYGTGEAELQPEVLRPANFPRLSKAEAERALSQVLAGQPDRSLESLLDGFERYRSVRERIRRLAEAHPEIVRVRTIGSPNGLAVEAIEFLPEAGVGQRTRTLITGGIHAGTEVVGMESAVRFAERAVTDPALRGRFALTIVPLINPAALVLGTRENLRGVDINRRFQEGKWTPETRVVGDYVRGKTFDVAVDLHAAGDPGRNGFFLISGKPDRGMGARIMRALPSASLLDVNKPGETSVGPYRLKGLGVTTIDSITGTAMDLLVRQGTPYVYTFEAPTRANPEWQVRGTLRMVESALNNARQHGELIVEAREREVREPATDRLARFRNADGTLNWKALRGRAAVEAAGLANFGLALFLKELAVVARTGDRARIEEFFEGLLTTDFYKEYGLFVLGARAGQAAYVRYLERFVKPRFVNGILRTNLVLAAGLALPRIADGTFTGKAFAISLTSLGLSSAAVSGGMASIRWVTNLRRARETGTLARLGLGASRFAKLGGWFYKAAELAVVLFIAEDIEHAIHAHLDLAEARDAFADAGLAFTDAVADDAATPESVREATERFRAASADYRNFLYRPLQQDEMIFAARLEKAAREAKLADDRRRALLERLERFPSLSADVVRRFGSLEAYARALAEADERAIQDDVVTYMESYNRARDEHLREVYEENERGTPFLAGAPSPFVREAERSDAFGRWAQRRQRAQLRDALEDVSENRLEAYEDELALLGGAADALEQRGDAESEAVVRELMAGTARARAMDDRLVHDADGIYLSTRDRDGALEALEAATR